MDFCVNKTALWLLWLFHSFGFLLSINPIIVLPPVIYWNSSNFVSVTWLKGENDVHRGFLKVFKDNEMPPFASNIMRLQPGEVSLFELPANKVGIANEYKITFHKSSTGYKSELFTVRGTPDIKNIFIQTDKPLYKPGQLVQIRLLPITSLGSISNNSLEVQLESPDRFILMSRTLSADGSFIRTEFQLPSHLSFGFWRIRVTPTVKGSRNDALFFKEFEVKEYDLPHFQVKMFIESEEELFETGDTGIVVVAKYSFGKAAFGEVKVYCGRQQIGSSESLFAQPIITGEIEDGLFRGRLNISACNLRHWRKRRVELTASVRDQGTGDLESDWISVEPRVEADWSVNLLKPGFGEEKWSSVAFLIESASHNVKHPKTVYIEALCMPPINGTRISILKSFEAKIGAFLELNVTGNECSLVMLNITDPERDNNAKLFAVPRIKGLASMIKVGSTQINPAYYQAGSLFQASVELSEMGSQTSRVASYMLLCNNEIMASGKSSTTGNISIRLTENMVPGCFLVVYRLFHGDSEFPLVDIFKFSVASGCSTNVNITTHENSLAPGSVRNLVLRGPANGLAGIRAYDERISYLLEKEIKLAENKKFAEWEFLLTTIGASKMNNLFFSGLFERSSITSSIERSCQYAGNLWWNKFHKCPQMLTSESSVSSLCQEQLISHCGAMDDKPIVGAVCENGEKRCSTSIPANKLMEDPIRLDFKIGEEESKNSESEKISVRNFFPETWLFHEFRLNSTGAVEVQAAVPHSVTNWTVSGHFWGHGWQQICAAAPVTITSFKKFFLRVELPDEVYVGEFLLVKATVFLFDPNWHETEGEHKIGICYRDTNQGVCTDIGAEGRRYTGAHILTMVARKKGTGSKTLPFEFLETGEFKMRFDLKDFQAEVDCNKAPLLDSVERTVLVKDRETVEDYSRSFIINPTKPKTSVTTNELDDEYIQYTEFLDEDNEKNRNKLRAQIDVRIPDDVDVNRFDVEFTRFLSHVRPTSLPSLDESSNDELSNEILPRRSRRRRSAQFLSEILKKTSVVLHEYKAGAKPGQTLDLVDDMETMLAEIFTFSDCRQNQSQCGYSQTRWPTKESQRSQWLTILATSLNCEAGVNATVVCPSLRWILMLQQRNKLNSDYTDMKLATQNDEKLLIEAMVFAMIYECSSYKEQCEEMVDQPFPLGQAAQDLYFGFTVDEKETDPIAIAAVTYAVSYANSPLMDVFQHYLYGAIKQNNVAPFWTYGDEESMMEKIKNRLRAWLGSSQRRLRKANEILLNSLGFLAFVNEQSEGINLNLDPLADWLFSQQKSTEEGMFYYTLDTYFATRAIYLYKAKKSGFLGHKNLTVTLDCPECSFVERRLDDRTSVIHIPSYAKRLRVTVSGMDKVKFGVRMLLSKPQRLRRHLDSGEETEKWPMEIQANTVIVGPGPVFNQTVCLKTIHTVLTDMVGVEHGIFTGYSPDKNSFKVAPGSGCVFHGLDVSSHLVQFLLTNLTSNKEHCYSLSLNPPSVSHSSSLAPVPVMTKHPEHGLTGMVYLQMNSPEEVTRSQVDKVCYADDHCVCTEGSCQDKKCDMCQNEQQMTEMTEFVCRSGTFGVVVKSTDVEMIDENYVKMTASVKHKLTPDGHPAECQECEIYQRICRSRGELKCPLPEKDKLYFVAGISSKWHVDANSTLPVYFVGEKDYFEPFLTCSANWQQRVLSMSSTQRRIDICREHLRNQ